MSEYRVIQLRDAEPWPGLNPRTHFDAGHLDELARSIQSKGLLEPIVVHDRGEGTSPRYHVVAGERRFRAAHLAELTEVPAVIGVYTEAEALDVALIENLQRQDMSVLDEARAFRRRLEVGDITQEQLAARIGIDQSTVANRLRLLELPEGLQKLIDEGALLPSHARDVILPYAGIPEKKWKQLTKEVEQQIRQDMKSLFAKETLRADDVKDIVHSVARDISHSLRKDEYGAKAPLFDPKKHAECGCNGPAIETYGGKKEARCFNDAWWNAQQKAATERAKEREKKAREKAAAVATSGGPKKEYASMQSLRSSHGYDYEIIGSESGFEHSVYDLAKIPAEKLVFVPDTNGLKLVCLDRRAASKGSVRKERDEMLAQRRREAADAELAEAKALTIKPVDAYRLLIAELVDEDTYNNNFLRMLEDIGVDVNAEANEDDESDEPLGFDLGTISADQLTGWVKLFALRSQRGDYKKSFDFSRRDPLEEAVDKELRKKYSKALRAMFAAREDAPTPSTNGKKPKPKKKDAELVGAGAAAATAAEDATLSAARRAAEAVRMSGLFTR